MFLSCLKRLSLIIMVMMLSHCTKITTESQYHVNKQLATPYTMSAAAYMALANNQAGAEKQALLMMAAGRFIADGQWQQGSAILTQITPLTDDIATEKLLLLAKIDLMRSEPRAAITRLSSVHDIQHLSLYYLVQFHEMLASAYHAVGNTYASVVERIKLETLLPDESSRANNRRVLWLALTTMPIAELHALAAESADNSAFKGWMQLALISKDINEPSHVMLAHIEEWQAEHPTHPANTILPTPLDTVAQLLYPKPRRIAVLLPLTGPLAGPAHAVLDGFMAAYDASGESTRVSVQTYDTYAKDVIAVYRQAIADGAEYIVGPLAKADVAAVANVAHPVPTLLLNDLERSTAGNAYQFGLSPSFEARQVASRARKQGYTRALVIAPAGQWGVDVVRAFTEMWRVNGGEVVDSLIYQPAQDLNQAIRDFLHVSDSEARAKHLRQALGHHVEALAQRRQDFDVVFLLSYPSKARQIMPLLRYYYLGDVPVYATSAVYSGSVNTMKDRDLDGITFCDMPWVFTHQIGNRNWPEQFNSYNRLYALGLDSYALTTQLNQLLLFPAVGVNDKSGVLYLNPSHQISRIFVFGKFMQGTAQTYEQ